MGPRYLHQRLTRLLDVLVRGRLWLQVLIALAAGIGVGVLLGPDLAWMPRDQATLAGAWLALPGKLFLALIRMVIVPLAASSIVLGLAGSGGGEAMRLVGRRLVAFVLATTVFATAVGIVLGQLASPGAEIEARRAAAERVEIFLGDEPELPPAPEAARDIGTIALDLPELITGLIPQNITASLLDQDMLAIVIFALFVGVAVMTSDRRELTKPLVALAEAVLEVSMTVIRTAMRFAPLAVFGLIAQTVAANGVQTLENLAVYCGVVLAGLIVLLLTYLVLVPVLGRMSPIRFLAAVGPVQLLAFSTSSSAAVMPLTMKTAVERLGVEPTLAGAIIPLASTVNMAGTALYQSVAIMFLADIGGVELAIGDLALMMVTLTGASIGAPAAPGASVAILAATAASFGVPLTGLPLVLGVDRILDMVRTAVNVTGDLVLCRVLAPRNPG
jgi:Na+/H+-dicarboxylate symporter